MPLAHCRLLLIDQPMHRRDIAASIRGDLCTLYYIVADAPDGRASTPPFRLEIIATGPDYDTAMRSALARLLPEAALPRAAFRPLHPRRHRRAR